MSKVIQIRGKEYTPGKLYSFGDSQASADRCAKIDFLDRYKSGEDTFKTIGSGCYRFISDIKDTDIGVVSPVPIVLKINEYYMLKSKATGSTTQVRRWNGEFFVAPNSTPIFGEHANVQCHMVKDEE